jgi:hypothetical protein
MSHAPRHLSAILGLALILRRTSTGAAQDTQSTYHVTAYGPLLLALELAYKQWVGDSAPPSPAAFTATADASSDPFVITFSPTPGGASRVARTTFMPVR